MRYQSYARVQKKDVARIRADAERERERETTTRERANIRARKIFKIFPEREREKQTHMRVLLPRARVRPSPPR